MNPRVTDVLTRDDHSIVLRFSNGEVRHFDVTPLLNQGVFCTLRDLATFRQARVCYGTVVWPHEIDICPDTLYEDGSPLEEHNNPFHEASLRSARERAVPQS